MPAPQTGDSFLALVQKSGLADEARLTAFVDHGQASGQPWPEPRKLAGQLIRDGLLTYFQSEQLLMGKWRGFSIGKYKLLERIGVGGMGQVFLAEHTYMRRRVAIKVLPPAKADDPSARGRFYREARAAALLDHPNIVRTHDIDQDGTAHFLVMEYVDGINLLDLVRRYGPLEVPRAAQYVWQSCQGLAHAVESGMVHRDIKPGNLMVDRQGMVKLLDMGLARIFEPDEDLLTLKYDDQSVLGTADYVSPEQTVDSHNVDIRTDIYSLGATFYYLLTGKVLFPEGTITQKLIWHQTRMPRPVRELRPEVPVRLAAVVTRMLAKSPADRYQTPTEVAEALAPWESEPVEPLPEEWMPKLSPAAREPIPGTTAPSDGRGMGAGASRLLAIGRSGSAVAIAVPPRVGQALLDTDHRRTLDQTPPNSRRPASHAELRTRKAAFVPRWLIWAGLAVTAAGLLLGGLWSWLG